jgi:hypothetical protein
VIRIPTRGGNLSLLEIGSGAHSASYPSGALSLRVKGPECEADHSPPSSAEVKKSWSYTSTPQYTFKAWCSVKDHGDGVTFTNVITYPNGMVIVTVEIPQCFRIIAFLFLAVHLKRERS